MVTAGQLAAVPSPRSAEDSTVSSELGTTEPRRSLHRDISTKLARVSYDKQAAMGSPAPTHVAGQGRVGKAVGGCDEGNRRANLKQAEVTATVISIVQTGRKIEH